MRHRLINLFNHGPITGIIGMVPSYLPAILLVVCVSFSGCSVKEVRVPVRVNIDEAQYTVLRQDTLKNPPGIKRILYIEKRR